MRKLVIGLVGLLISSLCVLQATAAEAQKFFVKPVVEKKIPQLPAGPLFWQIENFPTLEQAQAAAGPTSLAAAVAGKVWLFTLGSQVPRRQAAAKSRRSGPVPPITARSISCASTSPAARLDRGPRCIAIPVPKRSMCWPANWGRKTRVGVTRVDAGQTMNGHHADTPMEVFSSGTTDLIQLVMFVVDATRPFSSPARLP